MTPLFGHSEQQKWIMARLGEDKLHHGIILAGRQGLGKALFALHAATEILEAGVDTAFDKLPSNSQQSFGKSSESQTYRLVSQGTHPDLQTIERGPKNDTERKKAEKGQPYERRRNITIDQIRTLQSRFATRPTLGDKRVIIIDAADDLERSAANALLKSLEEPPQDTHFLLISHNPGKLLPTIRSRCQMLRFAALSDNDMKAFLDHKHADPSPDLIAHYMQEQNGIPGEMIALIETSGTDIRSIAREIMNTGDHDQSLRLQLVKNLGRSGSNEAILTILRGLPPLLAEKARNTRDARRTACLTSWSQMRKLLDTAPIYNYDRQALIFRVAGLLAAPGQIREQQTK